MTAWWWWYGNAATGVSEQTGEVAPVAIAVTPVAVTATFEAICTAAVAPVVVNDTPVASTATSVAEYTAAVVPVVINVTLPAVTAGRLADEEYRVLELRISGKFSSNYLGQRQLICRASAEKRL